MFRFSFVQIIRAPAPEMLLDEGRAALEIFEEEEKQRTRENAISGRLRSSFRRKSSQLFKAEPSASQLPHEEPQVSRLSAKSAIPLVGLENGIFEVEVEVSGVRDLPA